MSGEQISFYESEQIFTLFKTKGWPIDSGNKFSLYNRFIHTYMMLEKDERELFLELSLEFKLVNLNEYQDNICDILTNMVTIQFANSFKETNIYVMPLISRENNKKIKSSTFIVYLFMSTQLLYRDCLVKKNFQLIYNYEHLESKKYGIIKEDKPLLLVDDFIGSGTQAMVAIKEIETMGFKREQLFVVAPFIHEVGLKQLNNEKVNCSYSMIIPKSMSSNIKRNSKQKIMENIEKKINVNNGYSLGYMQSEALISLVRTPNNTLPIFWYGGNRSKKGYAPFPRMI
jgi:hypothetical protein